MSESVRLVWTALPDPAGLVPGQFRVRLAVGFVGQPQGVESETDPAVLRALCDWPAHLRGRRYRVRVAGTGFDHLLEAVPHGPGAPPARGSSALWRQWVAGQVPAEPCADGTAKPGATETPDEADSAAPSTETGTRVVLSYPAVAVARNVRRQVLDRALTMHALATLPTTSRVQDVWDVTDSVDVLRPGGRGASRGAALNRGLRGTLEEGARAAPRSSGAQAADAVEAEDTVAAWRRRWANLRAATDATPPAITPTEAEAMTRRLAQRVTIGDADAFLTMAEEVRDRQPAADEPEDAQRRPAGAEPASDIVARPFRALQAFHGAAPDVQDEYAESRGAAGDAEAQRATPERCPQGPESSGRESATRTWDQRDFFERVSIARNHLPLLERLGLAFLLDLALSEAQHADLARALSNQEDVRLQAVLEPDDPLRPRSVLPVVVCAQNRVGGCSPRAHPEVPWVDKGMLEIRGTAPARFCVEHMDVDAAGLALLAEAQAAGEFPDPQILTDCDGRILAANAAARLFLLGDAGAAFPGDTLEPVFLDRAEMQRALRAGRAVTRPSAVFSPRIRLELATRWPASDRTTQVSSLTWSVERAHDAGFAVGDGLRWRLELEEDQAPARFTDPPALRTRGVSLLQEQREFVVQTLVVRRQALQQEFADWFADSTRPVPVLYAGDVNLGFLCDLWSPEVERWCSVSRIVEEYDAATWNDVEPRGGARPPVASSRAVVETQGLLRPGVWQRFDAASGFGHVKVPEDQTAPAVVAYDGMSLGAPSRFAGWQHTACDDEVLSRERPDGSPVLATRAVDETLPPLRYTRGGSGPSLGWIRIRAVDLAGQAVELPERQLGEEESQARLPFELRRMEPILPPTVLVDEEGRDLHVWACRGPRDLVVDAARPDDVRWLAPPACDLPQVERHGLGDVLDRRSGYGCLAFGLADSGTFRELAVPPGPDGRDRGKVPAYRRRGSGTWSAQPDWPFLPDPLARGVRAAFVPDFALHGRPVVQCWAPFYAPGERWPSADPIRVKAHALPSTADEPSLSATVSRGLLTCELAIPPGWSGAVYLSCGTGRGPEADVWSEQHALLRALELGSECGAGISLPPDGWTGDVPAARTPRRAAAKLRARSSGNGAASDAPGGARESDAAPTAGELRAAFQEGRLPGLNPPLVLRVSHAVPAPLETPRISVTLRAHRGQPHPAFDGSGPDAPARKPGTVALHASIEFDPRTTSRVEVHASWEEDEDGVGWLTARRTKKSVVVATVDVATHALHREGRLELPFQHAMPSAGHYHVAYRAVAVSRYADCYPELAPERRTRESLPCPVDVYSQRRPEPVVLDRVVPSYAWSEHEDIDPPTREPRWTIRRRGGIVRVRVSRPWPTTGPGQLLGVVVSAQGISDADLRDLAPGGDGEVPLVRGQLADATLLDTVSTWAWDPVAPPGPLPGALHPTDFGDWKLALRVARASVQPQGAEGADDLPAGDDGPPVPTDGDVIVLGYALNEDANDGTWFADVPMREPRLYGAFVRLSLVRLQPKALDLQVPCQAPAARSDNVVSTRVLTPFVELPVERTIVHWTRRDQVQPRLVVSLQGARNVRDPAPIEMLEPWGIPPAAVGTRMDRPPNEVDFHLFAEVQDTTGEPLCWMPIGSPPLDAEHIDVRLVRRPACLPDEIARCEMSWDGPRAPERLMLVVREYERYVGDPSDPPCSGTPPPRRPVFAGIVDV